MISLAKFLADEDIYSFCTGPAWWRLVLSVSYHVFQRCGHFKCRGKVFECKITHFIGDWHMYNIQHDTQGVLWNTQGVLVYLKLCAAVPYKKVVWRSIYPSFTYHFFCHQTIQGKRRFSYLILLSPDKQMQK